MDKTFTAFKLGDNVRKKKGSQWTGRVVGYYSTELTPEGYAVESSTETGSVQIYPAAALELDPNTTAYGQEEERAGAALREAGLMGEAETLCEAARIATNTYWREIVASKDKLLASLPTVAAPAELGDFPSGAIHNGEAFAERLENIYDFQCEAGPLRNCYEWTELRRCMGAMAEYLTQLAAKGSSPATQQGDPHIRELAHADKSPVKINNAELAAFHRFCDCCDDFDSGGHDVDKDMMLRLARIGVVRSTGFGRYETTKFGDWLRDFDAATQQAEPNVWTKERVAALSCGIAEAVANNVSTVPQLTFPHIYLGLCDALLAAPVGPSPVSTKPSAPTHYARRFCAGDAQWTDWKLIDAAEYARRKGDAGFEFVALVTPTAAAQPSAAIADIAAERQNQIRIGYDAESDDKYVNDEIAAYASVYAMPPAAREWNAADSGYGDTFATALTPWDWHPHSFGDRRRELVRACAMLVAEIERLDRAAQK